MGHNKFTPGCKCCGGVTPPNCTTPLTVHVAESCYGSLAGATITVKNSAGSVVATGSTNASGDYSVFLPTGTYRVSALIGSTPPTSSTGGSAISGSTDRSVPCIGSVTFTFPPMRFKATANGCSGRMPGVTVTLVRAGVTLGSGVTDSAGVADILLGSPNAPGANLAVTFSGTPYFRTYAVSLSQPSTAQCSVTANLSASGTNPDGSQRGVTPPYRCCATSFIARARPLPETLTATVGGESCTLTSSGGTTTWTGYITKTVVGRPRTSGGAPDCFGVTPDTSVSVVFQITWECGTLGLSYLSCTSQTQDPGIKAVASDLAQFLAGTTRLQNTYGQSSGSAEPTVISQGSSFPDQLYLNGPWTVTE